MLSKKKNLRKQRRGREPRSRARRQAPTIRPFISLPTFPFRTRYGDSMSLIHIRRILVLVAQKTGLMWLLRFFQLGWQSVRTVSFNSLFWLWYAIQLSRRGKPCAKTLITLLKLMIGSTHFSLTGNNLQEKTMK